jgi:hypothetical protein
MLEANSAEETTMFFITVLAAAAMLFLADSALVGP